MWDTFFWGFFFSRLTIIHNLFFSFKETTMFFKNKIWDYFLLAKFYNFIPFIAEILVLVFNLILNIII